jgi:hypothetical protein
MGKNCEGEEEALKFSIIIKRTRRIQLRNFATSLFWNVLFKNFLCMNGLRLVPYRGLRSKCKVVCKVS